MQHISLPHTMTETAEALQAGKLSARQLLDACLSKAALHDGLLNTVAHFSPFARQEAEACDSAKTAGETLGPLHGIPVFFKDNIAVRGLPTTVGSGLFDARPAVEDAAVVARLRAAGAVMSGKANMDELAAHVSGKTSFFGPTINPWRTDLRLSPGGSSSGAAAAVAAGFCCAAVGTDTGGSVRLPAGWCGICGLRPTRGMLSAAGVYPRAVSLDTVGFFARSVKDLELLLRLTAEAAPWQKTLALAPSMPRLGIFSEMIQAKASADTAAAYAKSIAGWERLGAECISVSLPLLEDPTVTESLGSIRSYEFARDIAQDVENNPAAERMHAVPAADYRKGRETSHKTYEDALQHKARLTAAVQAFFDTHNLDALLLPAAYSTAVPLDAPWEAFTDGRALVNLFSMVDVPTLVVPAPPAADAPDRLPVGMQLTAPTLGDRRLLDLGLRWEAAYGPFPVPTL